MFFLRLVPSEGCLPASFLPPGVLISDLTCALGAFLPHLASDLTCVSRLVCGKDAGSCGVPAGV